VTGKKGRGRKAVPKYFIIPEITREVPSNYMAGHRSNRRGKKSKMQNNGTKKMAQVSGDWGKLAKGEKGKKSNSPKKNKTETSRN